MLGSAMSVPHQGAEAHQAPPDRARNRAGGHQRRCDTASRSSTTQGTGHVVGVVRRGLLAARNTRQQRVETAQLLEWELLVVTERILIGAGLGALAGAILGY